MTTPLRQQIIDEVKLMLGGGMVDIELDPAHYSTALNISFDRYRQRSGNAVEESYLFLRLEENITDYYLPDNVNSVRQLFRRGLGGITGGTQIDPFSLAYTNLYLLQAGAGGGYTAGLLTYELFYEYLDQAGRMFGRDINFTFDVVTKRLSIVRRPSGNEQILIWCYMDRPDDAIIKDGFARPWIRDYTLAWCQQMLGEAYSKYNNLAGPSNGTTLKGDALKTEAKASMERLEKEIDIYIDNAMPLGIIVA
jgi:hypothetical protein